MKVLNPKQPFDASKITLGNPMPVQGGSYFTKLKIDDELLYAQMPKCFTRKGIVHTEKNDYCDLMYERNDEEQLIEWIENLESCCQDLIDNKKSLWFHTDLSRDDITTMMSPICRIYRSGKNILIRVNIDKNKHNGQSKCIAYNEEEALVEINSLLPEQKIIPLVIIDGIKFTSRSFEICISLHQFMILQKEEDLETSKRCLISRDKPVEEKKFTALPLSSDSSETTTETKNSNTIMTEPQPDSEVSTLSLGENSSISPDLETGENKEETADSPAKNQETPPEENLEIEEVNLDIANNNDSIQLKKSSEVYYEIYKDAKQKAKDMREAALKAYLEAEKIKMKFSLGDIDDESDFDDSQSDVSETSSIGEAPANLAEN